MKATLYTSNKEIIELLQIMRFYIYPKPLNELWRVIKNQVGSTKRLTYPPQSREPLPRVYSWEGYPGLHKFPTLKAQRGFFAKLNKGLIKVPYHRTQNLARALRFRFVFADELLTAEITIDESNLGELDPLWLLGERDQQSRYFRDSSYWIPFDELLLGDQDNLETMILNALKEVFRKIE